MLRVIVIVLAIAGCDRVLGLERVCDETLFGSECAACGGNGQACCASPTTCDDGLFCGDGTCNECVLDVAPGRRHMCSLRYDSTVWCSGQNDSGQLARPPSGERFPTPVQVMATDGTAVRDVIALGSGRKHSCAVRRDGTVWCWGQHTFGQLGDGTVPRDAEPVPVQVLQSNGAPLLDIVAVSGGWCHSCALDKAGGVACWGCNYAGQLGDGGASGRPLAAPVLLSDGTPFTDAAQLSVGHDHACALRPDGSSWCWGGARHGQIGDGLSGMGVYQPFATMIQTDVANIGAGSYFTCSTRRDGTAWCWGRAFGNRLGDGNDELPSDKPAPGQVLEEYLGPPVTRTKQIAVGSIGCMLADDTGVRCWGNDQYGTTGGFGGSTTPAPVIDRDDAQLTGVDRLVAHYARTCAHQSRGRFLCWGRNTFGELANGTVMNTGRPSTVQLSCP